MPFPARVEFRTRIIRAHPVRYLGFRASGFSHSSLDDRFSGSQ